MIRLYANNRIVYNKQLSTLPLHQNTLANIDIFYRICLYFTMECIILLGKSEHNMNEYNKLNNELLLRLLTPLCKLYTAKCAVNCVSEAIECMGGIGYLETSMMPRIYRDAQVLPVWEGTTNVLSLDVLRVLKHKINGRKTWKLYYKRVDDVIKLNMKKNMKLKQQLDILQTFWNMYSNDLKVCELYGRDISFSFFKVYAAALLYEHAYYTKSKMDMSVYRRFVNGNMQSSFFGGDCGKCLVSQALLNLLENRNEYDNQIKYLKELAMGKYSKL